MFTFKVNELLSPQKENVLRKNEMLVFYKF